MLALDLSLRLPCGVSLLPEESLYNTLAKISLRGLYKLYVQKQAGTRAHALKLDLDFGKTVKTYNTEFIKEIQLLKGPASSIYGTNTMGGILNIITKEPSKNFIKKIGISIKRNNTNKIYAFLSKKFHFANLLLSFSRFHSDGLVLSNKFTPTDFEDGHIKENDTKTSYNLNSSIDFTINDFHKIGLKFSYDN